MATTSHFRRHLTYNRRVLKRIAANLSPVLLLSGCAIFAVRPVFELISHRPFPLQFLLWAYIVCAMSAILMAILSSQPVSGNLKGKLLLALVILALGVSGAWKTWHQMKLLAAHGFLLR